MAKSEYEKAKANDANGGTRATAGSTQEYTAQSLSDLYALGGNLTQYTDTLESLKDYDPSKYASEYLATETSGGMKSDGTASTKTTHSYKEHFYEAAEFSALKSEMMPKYQARLGTIKSQRDQPGRAQLLGNQSLLG